MVRKSSCHESPEDRQTSSLASARQLKKTDLDQNLKLGIIGKDHKRTSYIYFLKRKCPFGLHRTGYRLQILYETIIFCRSLSYLLGI